MAGTVRDLFLAVRVTDRATGPLRRISADLKRMQGTGAAGAAAQRERLMTQQRAGLIRQQRLMANIESATASTGARRIALNQRMLAQRKAEADALSTIEKRQRAVTANVLAQDAAAGRVTAIQRQPDIDAAERRRLQSRLRTAQQARRNLAATQRTSQRALRDAQIGLAGAAERQFKAETNIHDIQRKQTANLAAQEASRARMSKMTEAQIPMRAMRQLAVGPLPAEAGARAALLRHRALLQEEAVLQRRLSEAQTALSNLPAKEAAAATRVKRIEDSISKNKTAQLASTQKITALEQQIARTPTRARSALALEKDLQNAQLAYQDLINAQSTLQRDLRTAENARTRLHLSNQRIIADEQKLAQETSIWRNQLQSTTSRLSSITREINALDRTQQLYLRQENNAKWLGRARVIEHLGHALTLLGLAATAAFGIAAKTAADFSTQATLAATQARPPGAPVARTAQISTGLQRVVLRQMREFPASAAEMQQALYDIFSGTNIQNIGKASQLLRIFNMEAVAGGTDLDTMVQAGITLYNNFPGQFRNATAAGNRFFAMVRYGRGTADQFAQALNPIIPIAKQAGQTFDQVAGTLAFLSRQSRDVTQNAQGYARLLLLLARPEVQAGFKQLGISVTDSQGRIRDLLDIATELTQRFKLTPTQALTFFKTISEAAAGRGTQGTIQAQRVWSRIVNNVEQYRQVSRLATHDNTEFTRSFEALSKAPGVRWRVFINQMKALIIIIGTQAIPVFQRIGGYIYRLVNGFRNLSPHTQHLIGYFGAFVATALLVSGVLITLVGGLGSLYFILRTLSTNRALSILGAGAGGAAGQLGLLGLSIVPLVALFVLLDSKFHILDRTLDFASGSWTHFAIVAAGVVLVVMRLRAALIALETAELLRGGTRLATAAVAVDGLASGFGGLSAAAASLPAAFYVAAGAIAVLGGAALVNKYDLLGLKDAARQAREELALLKAPATAIEGLRGLGGATLQLKAAQVNVRELRRQLQQLRHERATAPRAQRAGLSDQIITTQIQLAQAIDEQNAAVGRADQAFAQVNKFANTYARVLERIGQNQRVLDTLRQKWIDARGPETSATEAARNFNKAMRDTHGPGTPITDAYKSLQNEIKVSHTLADQFTRAFMANIQQFQNAQMLPRDLSPQGIRDMARFALQVRRRMLTLPEMRLFARLELNPASLNTARGAIATFIRQQRNRRIDLQARFPSPEDARAGIGRDPQAWRRTQARAANERTARIFRAIGALGTPAMAAHLDRQSVRLGAAITLGIASGVKAHKRAVFRAINDIVNQGIRGGVDAAEAHSPSRKTARQIGLPLAQGVVVGAAQGLPAIRRAGADWVQGMEAGISQRLPFLRRLTQSLTINLVPDLQEKQTPNIRNMTQGLRTQLRAFRQFNYGLAILHSRNVPGKLLDQLAALGAEGAPIITQLVNASDPQLKKYVKLWQQTMDQIDQSTNASNQKQKDALDKRKQMLQDAVDSTRQMYNDLLQQNQSLMGELFQGPQRPAIDFREQWGRSPRGSDLLKDLRGQVSQFQQFERGLNRLRRRGAPPELINQIRQQGISALPELQVLAKMQPGQWRAYMRAFNQGQRLIRQQTWKDLRAQLALYRRFGKNVGQAIANGIADETPRLKNEIRALVISMFPSLAVHHGKSKRAMRKHVDDTIKEGKKAGQIGSPSRRTINEIGIPLMEGIVVGMQRRLPAVAGQMRRVRGTLRGGIAVPITYQRGRVPRPQVSPLRRIINHVNRVAPQPRLRRRILIPIDHENRAVPGPPVLPALKRAIEHTHRIVRPRMQRNQYIRLVYLPHRRPRLPILRQYVRLVYLGEARHHRPIYRPVTPQPEQRKETHTHYHDHTTIKTDPRNESLESVLAKHRNRMRNRPRHGR